MSSKSLSLQHMTEWDQDQVSLIKSTVAKNATNDELALFLYRCKHMDLDPLKPGHIHFVKYSAGPGTIVIGVDGFRSKAAKTGKHTGTKRGILRSTDGRCIGAWAEVFRSNWTQPAREEVSLAEYNTGKGIWSQKPETMIKKVAEVAALRMAFPDELGGIYSDDEMQDVPQAEETREVGPREVNPDPLKEYREKREAVEAVEGNYVITFGKFKGKKLVDLDPSETASYVQYIIESAERDGKEIKGQVFEFVRNAKTFIESKSERPAVFEQEEPLPF